jgi:hypothetical protein
MEMSPIQAARLAATLLFQKTCNEDFQSNEPNWNILNWQGKLRQQVGR